MFAEWMRQLRTWLAGSSFDEELDEEMQFHRDMHEQQLRENGLSPAEAKRQAKLSFGSAVAARAESRESWGFAWLDSLGQDLRYGLRQLKRNRGFAATAIITIALGVGASAAIFTLVNAVLLRPLPYPEPDRLVVLGEELHADYRLPRTPDLDLHHIKDQFKSFSSIGAWARDGAHWKTPDGVRSIDTIMLDPDLLALLGVEPILGRNFTAEDEASAGSVVLLAYSTWLSQFGADPAAVGSTMVLSGEAFTVIGVLPPAFRVDWQYSSPAEAYTLLSRYPSYLTNGLGLHRWKYVARLRPGVSLEEARAEFETVNTAWLDSQPAEMLRQEPVFLRFADDALGNLQTRLWTLVGAGTLVFLIVCANLAGLLLARSVARRREMGLRASLGAARVRIARQLGVEAVLLALLGGAVGFLFCVWAFYGLKSVLHFYLPRFEDATVDAQTLFFAAAAAVVCAALGGVTPLLARSFSAPWDALRSDSAGSNARRKGRRAADVLVVAQFALSLALVVGAGLMARTFWNLMETDWGFDGSGLIAVFLNHPNEIHGDTRALASLGDELVARIAAVPGVAPVTLGPGPPVRGFVSVRDIIVGDDREEPLPRADIQPVAPNYFDVMRIPLLRGRPFSTSDREGSPFVAVINETLAERNWPAVDPIGQSFAVRMRDDDFQSVEIVGIARRVFRSTLQQEVPPIIYVSYRQFPVEYPTAVFRSDQDPEALYPAIRRATADLGASQPIRVLTVSEQMDDSYAEPRFYMALLSVFALLALTLAAVGLYGVVAYSVRARTAEIGLRLAVGAAPGQILRMVLTRGIRLAAIGVGLGAALAWAGVRLIEGLLFGVSAADPLTIASVCLLLFATALLACWIPARRAASIEPVSALRQE